MSRLVVECFPSGAAAAVPSAHRRCDRHAAAPVRNQSKQFVKRIVATLYVNAHLNSIIPFFASIAQIIALYGDVLLRLSGFYALIESGAVQDECSADKATHMYFGGKRKLVEDNLNMDGLYNSGSATGLSSTLISGVDIGLVVVGLSAVAGAWAGAC